MKKYTRLVVLVILIGVISAIYVVSTSAGSGSHSAADHVLDNLAEQNYEKAFERIYYYDKAADLEPIIAFEEAKEKWVSRVNKLKDDGIYLKDYKNLRVKLDDSYPFGTVDLVFLENNKEVVKENVRLWFGKSKDGWKLGNFDYLNAEEEWEIALSGYVNQ